MQEKELNEEKKYLNKVSDDIIKKIKVNELLFEKIKEEKEKLSKHYSEEYYNMDDEEALVEGDDIKRYENLINISENQLNKLYRQRNSPYFGRVDFIANDEDVCNKYYIGIGSIIKDKEELPLVCDWRAPVSSLFYDYELGSANYFVNANNIGGNITLKRQFKIDKGELIYALNSDITIGDDILEKTLAENSNSKMKTIVSTIQKEQNKIIRNDIDDVVMVQGVAGSGKTSIALHRVAYLLYKNRETLKASDILIISPNKIFGEFISDVLPELGEENISQTTFLQIAKNELKAFGLGFETREEMLEDAIDNNQNRLNEIAYKNSFDFFESLKIYLNEFLNEDFKAKDLKLGEKTVSKEVIEKLYNLSYKDKTPAVKIAWITDYILDQFDIVDDTEKISERVKIILYGMYNNLDIFRIYDSFMKQIGMKFNLIDKKLIKNDDLSAILYIKNYILGFSDYSEVKYLIVDEMQDYSPIVFDLFNNIFKCKKTILGDINQCIEKIITKQDLDKLASLVSAKLISLEKAYRSSFEINQFACAILGKKYDCVKRHGECPEIISIKTCDQGTAIYEILDKENDMKSIAILTRTIKEAENLYYQLGENSDVKLVTNEYCEMGKIVLMPIFMAKGLEFDMVILCDLSSYESEFKGSEFINKNLMYIGATRALHKLKIITPSKGDIYRKYLPDCEEY